MEAAGGILIFVFVIAAVIGCRLFAGQLNHGRIREHIENMGGEVLVIHWDPFGPGWFGEKSDAIYEVDYRDRDGNHRRAHCKTSMFSGVYLSNDRLVFGTKRKNETQKQAETFSSPDEENRTLKEENRRLKEEIERLKTKGDA